MSNWLRNREINHVMQLRPVQLAKGPSPYPSTHFTNCGGMCWVAIRVGSIVAVVTVMRVG